MGLVSSLLLAAMLSACSPASDTSPAMTAGMAGASPVATPVALAATAGIGAVSARYVRFEAVAEVNGNSWTSIAELNVLDADGNALSRSGWVASADSQETVGEYAPASLAIDGDPFTFWHTQWQGANPRPPHALTIDLGAVRSVGGFRYVPRQVGVNGRVASWRFLTSLDGQGWTLVSQGTFTSSDAARTELLPASTGPVNQPPVVASIANRSDRNGTVVSQVVAARDPDGDPLSYSASGLPPGLSINPSTGTISGTPTQVGSFAVGLQISDGRQGSAMGSFTWAITAAAGSGSPLTAQYVRLEAVSEVNGNAWTSVAEFGVLDADGNAMTRTGWVASADSQETVGESAPASAAIDGDPGTFWHTQWQGANPRPPHALTVNLGSVRSLSGFRYVPRQGGVNGRIAGWRFYTSLDGQGWTLITQGTFASGDAARTEVLPMGGGNAAVNQPPVLSSIANRSDRVDTAVTQASSASDGDGDALAYTATGLPPGLSINRSTGLISGTPTQVGDYAASVQVSDGRQGSATRTFTWTITAVPGNTSSLSARFVRLEALSEVNGNAWTSIAELNILDADGNVIPRTGWVAGADSQETVGEYAPASYAIDGDPGTFWHTQWLAANPRPPHALTISLGSTRSIGGFRYLPRQGGVNGRIAVWRFYTSLDGQTWTLGSEGVFYNGDTAVTQTLGTTTTPTPPTPTPPTDLPPVASQTRASRIAAFASGPLVAANAWTGNESVNVDTVRRLQSGEHLFYTVAGRTGSSEPTLTGTAMDYRLVFDGSAVGYLSGRKITATQTGAPVVSTASNAAEAGLTQVNFFSSAGAEPRYAVAHGCHAVTLSGSHIEHYCFAQGPANGPANSTGVAVGAGWPSGYAYHTNTFEDEFVVTDRRFGVVFGNQSRAVNVEIDGVQVQGAPAISLASGDWTLVFDYQGVVKARRVRVISAGGPVGPYLRGVALSAGGQVDRGPAPADQVLILGDSMNNTSEPATEAGGQFLSYWLQRYLGFDGSINMAVGGSGYVAAFSGTYNLPSLLASIANRSLIAGYSPSIGHVIVVAAFNDRSRPIADVQAGALATWQELRRQLPNTRITITDGLSGSSGPDSDILARAAALAQTFAAWGDPNARLVRTIGTSQSTAYINGAGDVGKPIVAGNSSYYTSVDNTHLSPAGNRYVARRLADDIIAAWAGAY